MNKSLEQPRTSRFQNPRLKPIGSKEGTGKATRLFRFVSLPIVAILALTAAIFATPTAAFATYGSLDGKEPEDGWRHTDYRQVIDWVQWNTLPGLSGMNPSAQNGGRVLNRNLASQLAPNSNAGTVHSSTELAGGTLTTSCTLYNTILEGSDRQPIASRAVYFHQPGAFQGDGWDNFYGNRFVGIGSHGGRTLSFSVQCKAHLTREPGGPSIRVPLEGIVFSNAEVIDGGEYARLIPNRQDASEPVQWQLLESSSQCGIHNKLSFESLSNPYSGGLSSLDPTQILRVHSDTNDKNCFALSKPKPAVGPFFTAFAKNADGARMELKANSGNGGNFLAIGVVVSIDAGDAPDSYGDLATLIQPQIVGGDLVPGKLAPGTLTSSVVPASIGSDRLLPRIGSKGGDPDTELFSKPDWRNTRGDDESGRSPNDEDAYSDPLTLPITASGSTFATTITCGASDSHTYVAGWLDLDADGKFSAEEKSITSCDKQRGVATLIWQRPPEANPGDMGASAVAVRFVATTDSAVANSSNGATGIYLNGEVEDHAVTLVKPGISTVFEVVDSSGDAVESAGQGIEDVEYLASTPVFISKDGQTTVSSGEAVDGRFERALDYAFANPLDVNSVASSVAPTDVSISARIADDYQIYPQEQNLLNATCVPTAKQSGWSDSWNWPSIGPASVENTSRGVKVKGVKPTSLIDCLVKIQPYGQISVSPSVINETTANVDQSLKFSGTYSCTAPAEGPYSKLGSVSGTWGPVSAGQTWESSAASKIPLGATCVVQQTKMESLKQASSSSPLPQAGSYAYRWKVDSESSEQVRVVARSSKILKESLEVARPVNTVEETPLVSILFSNEDRDKNALAGGGFTLSGDTQAGEINLDIKDKYAQIQGNLDVDNTAGGLRVQSLPAGNYVLTQTQAAAGFSIAQAPIEFYITQDQARAGKPVRIGTVVNERVLLSALPQIPFAGGMSSLIYIVLGGALVSVALFSAIGAIRARNRRSF